MVTAGIRERQISYRYSLAGVVFFVDLLEAVGGDVGVDLGGGDVGVGEEFLGDAEVGAAEEEVGGRRWSRKSIKWILWCVRSAGG